MIDQIEKQITDLVDIISKLGVTIATVESCTGGMLSQFLTAKSGSSQWFCGGLVTYSNESKVNLAGVNKNTLESHGPISKSTVEEMALGGLSRFKADLIVAITGLAGPAGDGKLPIGTVWISWCTRETLQSKKFVFDGCRKEVRMRSVLEACRGIKNLSDRES